MSTNRAVSKETEWLYEAAVEGNTTRVKKLLQDKNADVNFHQRAQYGSTPLIAAISGGHTATVQALLEGGADISALKTPDANSPLHEACFRKHPDIVRILLQYKDQHASSINDIFHPKDQETLEWSMINAQNQFGNTPLHAAAMAGCVATVNAMIEGGARVNAVNKQLSTPLHHACYCTHDNKEVIRALIEAKAEVNATDKNHSTPLIVAAKKNQLGAIELLLKAGADPTARNDSNRNAYASARLRKNLEAMSLLDGLAPEDDPLDPSPRESTASIIET